MLRDALLSACNPREWRIVRTYGRFASGGVFALALLAFAAPFATLSCGSVPLASVSGWGLVAGVTMETGGRSQHVDPVGSAIVAFAAIVLALALTIGDRTWCRMGQMILAGVGVIALFALKADIDAQAARTAVLEVSWEPGYWLSMLAMLNAAAAAAVSMAAAIARLSDGAATAPLPSTVDKDAAEGHATRA